MVFVKPKVKESEKSRILRTDDYSLFEMPDNDISSKYLEIIKDSLIEKNLIKDCPILVDDNYKILDGKYRFLALYQLRETVFYKIAESTNEKDAIRLKQINKKSPIKDIVKVYSDLPQYNNIIKIYYEFNGVFSYELIVGLTQACCGLKGSSNKIKSIARAKLASGRMEDYNYEQLIGFLKNVLYVHNEYKFSITSAVELLIDLTWEYNEEIGSDKAIRTYRDMSWIIDNSIMLNQCIKIPERFGRTMCCKFYKLEECLWELDQAKQIGKISLECSEILAILGVKHKFNVDLDEVANRRKAVSELETEMNSYLAKTYATKKKTTQ